MKTATIEAYRTGAGGWSNYYYYADVFYRGKRIARKEGSIERDVVKATVEWTIENGFTHYKLRVV